MVFNNIVISALVYTYNYNKTYEVTEVCTLFLMSLLLIHTISFTYTGMGLGEISAPKKFKFTGPKIKT